MLHKAMQPVEHEEARLDPLDYNIKYGPHAFTLTGARAFLAPIQPQ